MASNLSVNVTADTTDLRTKLALAQADLKAFGAETRQLAQSIRTSGDSTGALRGQLQSVAAQFNRAKSEAAGLTANLRAATGAAREHSSAMMSIGASAGAIRNVSTELRTLAGVFGVAFGAEKAVEFTKRLLELGEHTQNVAASVGLSVGEFSLLSQSMKLVGGDADLASRSLIILQQKLVEAVGDPASKARAAFEAMGVSEKEMRAGLEDLPGFLKRLANAFVEFGQSANKTTAFREIFGRGLREIIPYLREGAAGIERFNAVARASGSVLSEYEAEALAKTDDAINELGLAFTGLGKAIVLEFNEPIRKAIESLREFIGDVKTTTDTLNKLKVISGTFKYDPEKNAWKAADDWIKAHSGANLWKSLGIGGGTSEAAAPVSPAAPTTMERGGKASWFGPWPGHPEWADKMNEGMPNASGLPLSTAGIALYDPSTLGKWFVVTGPDGRQFVLPQVDVGPAPWTGKSIDINAPAASLMGYTPKTFPTGANFSYRPATAEEVAAGGAAPAAKSMAAPVDYALLKKQLEEKQKELDEELKAREAELDLEITAAKGNQETIAILEKQKTDTAKEFLDRKVALNQAADERIRQSAAGYVTELIKIQTKALAEDQKYQQQKAEAGISALESDRRILDQRQELDLQFIQRRVALGQLATDAAATAETKIVEAHAAAANAILTKEAELAAGQIKAAQEVADRKAELEAKRQIDLIKINQKAADAAKASWDKVFDPVESAFDNAIKGFISGTTTLYQALSRAGETLFLDPLLKNLTGGLKSAFSSAFGDVSGGLVGKFFGGTLLSSLLFERGGIVPSMPSAAGGWMVPQTGSGGVLANLHSREMVLPRNISEGLQAALGGGATTSNRSQSINLTYAPSINAPSHMGLEKILARDSRAMTGFISTRVRDGALELPGGWRG